MHNTMQEFYIFAKLSLQKDAYAINRNFCGCKTDKFRIIALPKLEKI